MLNLGNILEVKLTSLNVVRNVECLNVFHYENTGDPVLILEDAAQIFYNEFFATPNAGYQLQRILSDQQVFTRIELTNLDNPDEFSFYTPLAPKFGNVTGEFLPVFDCWAFLYQRITRQTRNGQKRFAGIPESLQQNGVSIVGNLTTLADVANALGSSLLVNYGVGVDPIFTPKIVRKTGAFTYSAVNGVAAVSYSRISTQNTRKR